MAETNSPTVGQRLRRIRYARGLSLRTVAELAGITAGYLSRLERGERALDSRKLIVALSTALRVSPSELAELPVTQPGDPATDVAVDEVRRALMEVGMGHTAGQRQPVEQLRARVSALLDAQQQCRHNEVGAVLPPMIRDLYTSAAGRGRDHGDVLSLLTLLHMQGTQAWLRDVGAPLDLAWLAVSLAQRAAADRDDAVTTGLAAFGAAHGLLAAGAFQLAAEEVDAATRAVGTANGERKQLAGMLTLTRSLVAAASKRPADLDAALREASELARRTGEANAWWFGFGPTNVGTWEMAVALEHGDHERAASVAEALHPDRIPSPQRRAAYWADYGRALARLRGRTGEAVVAFRRAELISPARVHRHPFVRDTVAELLARARGDAVGRELRGLAYRSGLPV